MLTLALGALNVAQLIMACAYVLRHRRALEVIDCADDYIAALEDRLVELEHGLVVADGYIGAMGHELEHAHRRVSLAAGRRTRPHVAHA